MNIRGKRIILRALESSDLPALQRWLNDPGIVGGLGDIHFPSSLYQQQKWFERIQSDEKTVRFGIQEINGELIGYTGFWNIHWRDSRAEHALVIGNESQGRGFGRETIMTCARYAFEEMGLHRLEATILNNNSPSLKVYEQCGFKIEGVMREHARRNGQWIDRTFLGLLISEYQQLVKTTEYWASTEEAS